MLRASKTRGIDQDRMSMSSTENELMLYRVLERANLTQYYDAFISQGGDDLYQLCEAGEEEFLEIMVLVGMSKKPLHVRRLQKALYEWATNPSLFRDSEVTKRTFGQAGVAAKGSILAAYLQHSGNSSGSSSKSVVAASSLVMTGGSQFLDRPTSAFPTANGHSQCNDSTFPSEHSMRAFSVQLENNFDGVIDKPSSPLSENSDQDNSIMAFMNSSGEKVATSPSASTGALLLDSHTRKIEKTAEEISQSLPYYAPKPLNMKKAIDKEIDEAMNLSEDDPHRMDLFRKYSAIYGRFDSKRRGGKQMNFHERCINEAAAQLCKHRPSLLTRREELFILARQVIREAGFQYSKGFRSKEYLSSGSVCEEPPAKSLKTDSGKALAVRDGSKHRFFQPASVDLSNLQDSFKQEDNSSPGGDKTTDYNLNRSSASDSLLRDGSSSRSRTDKSQTRAQSNIMPRKVLVLNPESCGEENGSMEEIDEQKEWQREVGLDSLQITPIHPPLQGTSSTQGSSIIQALKEGMRGLRSSTLNAVIKQEVSND